MLLWSAYPMFILSLLIIALQAPFILIGYITTVRKWRGLKQRVLWEHYNIVTASAFVANAWAVGVPDGPVLPFPCPGGTSSAPHGVGRASATRLLVVG